MKWHPDGMILAAGTQADEWAEGALVPNPALPCVKQIARLANSESALLPDWL